MKLAVLHPGGRDPQQSFPDGAGAPDEKLPPPLGYHAFAACTDGSFHRKDQTIAAGQKQVLVLIGADLKAARQSMVELRRAGKTVAVALADACPAQFAAQFERAAKFALFQEICSRADGAIATTASHAPIFTAAGIRHTEFIPAPCPIDDERWNFSIPFEERRGIFIGTRLFGEPAQNHLAALLTVQQLAASMYEPVTVFNLDGWRGRKMLARLEFDERLLRVVQGDLPYSRYLRIVAKHKLVWQLDASAGLGTVAGDALLARLPCIGGLGTTERLAFPDLSGHGRTAEQLIDLAARLLEHPHDCEAVIEQARDHARPLFAYAPVAQQLAEFYRRIAR